MRVDGQRLLDRLAELARVGATADGGVTRLAYSDEDRRARALVAGWMEAAGLEVFEDAATNVIGLLPGTDPGAPFLMSGSHLDSVVDGGSLDGHYGALAAIAVAEALQAHGQSLRHGFAVVGFSNEEGPKGLPSFVGSKALVGLPVDLDATDDAGTPLRTFLAEAGGDPAALATARWADGSIAAFLELHIEQGPVLEDGGIPIGVVDAITGRCAFDVVVEGQAAHAGTTPMHLRRDAAVVAARIVLAADELARNGAVRVATVGHLEVRPNVRNVVPGRVVVGVEVRDTDPGRLGAAADALAGRAVAIAAEAGVTAVVGPRTWVEPVATAPVVADCIRQAADGLGLASLVLPSGAGHDAQIMAGLAPTGMVFVPSAGGASHSPREYTSPRHLVDGADVLLHAVIAADTRLP